MDCSADSASLRLKLLGLESFHGSHRRNSLADARPHRRPDARRRPRGRLSGPSSTDLVAQAPRHDRAKLYDGDKLRHYINVLVNDEDVRYLDDLDTAGRRRGQTVALMPCRGGGLSRERRSPTTRLTTDEEELRGRRTGRRRTGGGVGLPADPRRTRRPPAAVSDRAARLRLPRAAPKKKCSTARSPTRRCSTS